MSDGLPVMRKEEPSIQGCGPLCNNYIHPGSADTIIYLNAVTSIIRKKGGQLLLG